jgi:hypothetical protein
MSDNGTYRGLSTVRLRHQTGADRNYVGKHSAFIGGDGYEATKREIHVGRKHPPRCPELRPGDVIDIDGLPGKWRVIEAKHDGERRTRCPACGHGAGGVCWNGWFTCEMCRCVAFYPEGTAFVADGVPAEVGK